MPNSRTLSKDLSYRKKPKELRYNKSNTWSSSSVKHQPSNNKLDITNFSSHQILPIEERIKLYEAKYMQCLNSQTQLLVWIKSTKEKGPPKPLIEGLYTPPTRSRLPDFLFSSLSTKSRRKSSCDTVAPTTKSSLSTFLKKATDSLSYKQVPPLKRQPKSRTTCVSTTASQAPNHRFSLTSSLNRFSLSKASQYDTKLTAATKPCTNINIETNPPPKTTKSSKRFSTPVPEKKLTTCSNQSTQNSLLLNKQKPRPLSTILPHSPSSIFLDRLRLRVPGNDTNQTVQSNISSEAKPTLSYSCLQTSTSSVGITDDDTPPSSPSSIDSVSTSPSITTPSLASMNRHKKSQDLVGKHKSSFLTAAEKKGFFVDDVIVEDERESTFMPLQHKKKRTSLLIAPSLSSIRLLSQKSQFLKRQSMLT